jgi:hypothetical protein
MQNTTPVQPTRGKKRKIREDKKPSCDACRGHKLRCDASLDYSRPCSRCLKKEVACVVQEQRKKTSADRGLTPRSTTSLASDTAHVSPPSNIDSSIQIPPTYTTTSQIPMETPISSNLSSIGPQSIGSVLVESAMIDICFARFYRYYAPLIPILTEELTPHQTLQESLLKFWVIVTIGSRKCLEDPTLFSTLSPHVETLALTSLCIGWTSPYPRIEAFLLMCNFHLSTDRPFWRNIYCTLTTAVVMLAQQSGMDSCLSMPGVFTSALNTDTVRGTKLWAFAMVLNQNIMSFQGLPNDHVGLRHLVSVYDCCATLPPWLVLQARIGAIVNKLHRMISDLNPEGLQGHSRMLETLVAASEAELIDLKGTSKLEDYVRKTRSFCQTGIIDTLLGILSKFGIAVAHLQIHSFTFLKSHGDINHTDRTPIYNAAILTIDAVSELDHAYQISLVCPDFVFQGAQLAACSLLKLLKSYPSTKDGLAKEQTTALFVAINFLKNVSVVNNDIPARVSELLSQLWSSRDVYRDASGAYLHNMQVGNRFTMNVVFDCLWWWKRLFGDPTKTQRPPGPLRCQREYSSLYLAYK